ncbi:YraN family protein [Hydromonas duriensis]|uniref:UPF0102 protein DFR44_11122 n=1 Tax=Hydromonas duriensis TaxID=1527608 RepID=A0A4R6Y7F4_9BURK|nr:YraN family protein [Hydromonas duriensis]TDR31259.1 putative endonuclease [Hydromonas duriensis]
MWAWLKKQSVEQKKPNEKSTMNTTMRTYQPQAAKQLDGAQAEAFARDYLGKNGLKVVQANMACTQGEIDLIMLDGDTLVFVEVRWRKSNAFGGAMASVTPHKLTKLMRACEVFMQQETKWQHHPCRIDVVALQGRLDAPEIEWVKNVTA